MINHSVEHLLFFLVLAGAIVINHSNGVEVNCSLRRSCESCHATYPKCYWTDSSECVRHCDSLLDNNCPNPWTLPTCGSRRASEREKLERIYKILIELRNRKKNGEVGHRGPRKTTLNSLFHENMHKDVMEQENEIDDGTSVGRRTSGYEGPAYLNLKKARLLKALRLLKLIELLEAKQRVSNLADLERSGDGSLGQVETTNQIGHLHRQENLNSKTLESSHDLDDLLNKVNPNQSKSHHGPYISSTSLPTTDVVTRSQGTNSTAPKTLPFTTASTEAHKFLGSTEKPLIAEENFVLRSREQSTTHSVPTTKPNEPTGCALYDEEDNCNNNSSCSWCNMLDSCMSRNEEDMKNCYSQTKRSATASYVIDRCLKHSNCEGCVKDSKCFWCEKTKSCHVYPFFGYVPHNCPANKWYYKDCDVQLAIFIILFPLLIILIAMIIFYFCLRYCYYRKRTLKVPLFEKPGLIEKKQGKKIYFMSGEDDDEDYRTEQIRKKYKLPVEKEPLIAP